MVDRGCAIGLDEIEWRFSPSGGPGGQHANRSNTRAEAIFDVAASPSLSDTQRARLLESVGETVRVVADDERSQARNRALALDRLRERLAAGLYRPPVRRPKKPSVASEQRRLDAKHRRAETKRSRAKPPIED